MREEGFRHRRVVVRARGAVLDGRVGFRRRRLGFCRRRLLLSSSLDTSVTESKDRIECFHVRLLQGYDSFLRNFSGSAAFRSRSLETQIGDLNMDASGVHFGELRRSIARIFLRSAPRIFKLTRKKLIFQPSITLHRRLHIHRGCPFRVASRLSDSSACLVFSYAFLILPSRQ